MTDYTNDDHLLISGIQHFAFCPRQWALIHIEQQWVDSVHTVDGDIFHERTHEEKLTEKRGNITVTRGMRIFSDRLWVTGQCDVVEFHRDENGVKLHCHDGLWQPYPVEYKKGQPKEYNADELQLCVQAMCLEEMLTCSISEGSLFYGEPRRRTRVKLTRGLRLEAEEVLRKMLGYYRRGYTPRPKASARCKACSLINVCLPNLVKIVSVREYMKTALEDSVL